MKKSVVAFLAASLCLAACQIEIVDPNTSDDVLSAKIEQNEVTKTVLGESNNVLWSENDQIVAFMKSSYGHKYQIKPSFAGKTYADFSRVSSASGDDLSAGMEWDHNVAYYPYSESIECVKSDDNYTLDVVLPAEQTYEENSFGNGTWPMVAVSEDNDITFNNVCGGIKLQLKGTQIVKSITIQGKNNEKLAGAATVTAYTDETKPTIVMGKNASVTVTLNCGEGVKLNENTITEFILSLPPVVFTKGFSVNVAFDKDNLRVIETDKENKVLRSSLLVMPEVSVETPANPEGTTIDLSDKGTANSYIVSEAGSYKFTPTKGNSSESVGTIASVEVLWESFGTDVTPNVGDLVKNVSYKNGEVTFQTADTFKEGNAVIAAKDASGTILWSWHIWLTDEPQGQVYYNNAGTMMDRNLGATSATPGDVGALGLLYQWGRKDPFLGSSSISDEVEAKSTITWPSTVSSNSSNGTIEYATAHPTTFITDNLSNYDWYYTGSLSTDDTRWTTSDKTKSIYDPCPSGWRVPDGGDNGVWSKASSSEYFIDESLYDITNEGMNFSGKFGSASTIWYPASGCRYYSFGGLGLVGDYGYYWSASPDDNYAYFLYFDYDGYVLPSYCVGYRADGYFVRCLQESNGGDIEGGESEEYPDFSATNLSDEGTANSYIVSKGGSYKFSAVKGNSSESVGAVSSAEVLWETFGTDVAPNVGDLVKNVSYKNGEVTFQTADAFKEGNAVIAAKDAAGTILWSWHIWLTDEPQGQEYYNNAGTMMDRNLGATSATPGDVGALGLLYQWGRKDPFLGSSPIRDPVEAKSTITWPDAVSSDSSNGTIDYAIAHPTTYITYNNSNYDWYYTGSDSTDDTRWTTSDKTKSIYDPCPSGWRVPDGGSNGVWSKALGSSEYFKDVSLFSSTNKGMNFSGKFGSASTIWYPASGYRNDNFGSLNYVGAYGRYWSASTVYYYAYYLGLNDKSLIGDVDPSNGYIRAIGASVRCLQESK